MRRPTREVRVGPVGIGGSNPIRVQSMTTTETRDVEATVAQILRLADAGCEIVRVTAPHVEDARALGEIKRRLRAAGRDVPLVADIHFKPAAAMEAALHVEKVRVNPGNFADVKQFRRKEYDDAAYAAEIRRIEEVFGPLVDLCRDRGVAMRIGVNHGSLSDRIMNRYGDTPEGMVECALEYVRIARRRGYHDIVLSMKASNPKVCVRAYRLLVEAMEREGMDYPLHLGVTEAGDGEDGRVKSALGIGTLLAEGLGDTIRVSLTEDPEAEIPVCRDLLRLVPAERPRRPAGAYERRRTPEVRVGNLRLGGENPPRVLVRIESAAEARAVRYGTRENERAEAYVVRVAGADDLARLGPVFEALRWDRDPAALIADVGEGRDAALVEEALRRADAVLVLPPRGDGRLVGPEGPLPLEVLVHRSGLGEDDARLRAAVDLGAPLLEGRGEAVLLDAPIDPTARAALPYRILQAASARTTRVEFIACPSCGRTLFDLQEQTARVRALTAHLVGLKIAVMGCVVNGPGEMADADFGYVGGAPGKINLFAGKECVERGVPQEEAPARLVELIRSRGRWVEPPAAVPRPD